MWARRNSPTDKSPVSSRIAKPLAVVLCILFSIQAASAQDYGRWWWEVLAGFAKRDTENVRDGELSSSTGQSDLRVSTALNGFIVNPAVARFRVVLDTFLSGLGSERGGNSNRFGLGGEISGFPKGKFPFRLFARQRFFAFENDGLTDPLILLRQPDTGYDLGGDFRIRRGAFRGIRLMFEQNSIDFEDKSVGIDRRSRQSFEFQRAGSRFRHRVRLENSDWDSALSSIGMGDFKVYVDEGAAFAENWQWQTYATGLRRTLTYNGGAPSETDFIDVRNRFARLGPGGDELVARYDFRQRSADSAGGATSNQVAASYRRNLAGRWQVKPFVLLTDISSGDSSSFEPRLGVTADWQWARPGVQVTLTPGAAYGRPAFEVAGSSYKQSNLNLSLAGVVGAGRVAGLRKEFEFQISRNDLRLLSEPIEELPDLGISLTGFGVYDLFRARFTLRHHWDGMQFDTWADWFRTEQPGTADLGGFNSESLIGNLQFTARRGAITANVMRTEADRGPGTEQQVNSYGVGGIYRPWRDLQLRVWYSGTQRQLFFAPDIDGVTYKIGLRYQWGRVFFGGEYFNITDRSVGGSELVSRGVQWTLSSQFSGWLPVLSSVKRRGVIR